MTPPEAAALLATIAANDGRHVTEANAHAWAAALPDVALADALEVLPEYYRSATRDSRNWIYPGDVLDRVTTLQRKRVSDAVYAAYTSITGSDYRQVVSGAQMLPERHDEGMAAMRRARKVVEEAEATVAQAISA